MARKKRTVTEEFEEEGLTPVDPKDDDADYIQLFEHFLEVHSDTEYAYNVVVYDYYLPAPGATEELSYLGCFSNRMPTVEEIARTYGSGRFLLSLQYRKKSDGKPSSRRKHLRISPKYAGTVDASQALVPAGRAAPAAAAYPAPPTLDSNLMLGLIKHFMTTVEKIITSRPSGNGGGIADMSKFNEAMGDMMLSNAKTQLRLVDELVKDRAGVEDPEEDPKSVIEWVVSLWRTYGDLILAGGKSLQKQMRKQVQDAPEMQEILASQAAFDEAYGALVQEAGSEKVGKMLDILGIQRPDPSTATGSDGTSSARTADTPQGSGQ